MGRGRIGGKGRTVWQAEKIRISTVLTNIQLEAQHSALPDQQGHLPPVPAAPALH